MSEDAPRYGANDDADQARTNELRALIEALGLSQRETADALEVDVRTLRYWASKNPAPPAMAILALRHLRAKQIAQTHWSKRSPDDPITPTDVAEVNRLGGNDAIEELMRLYAEQDSDAGAVFVQTPRGTL